MIKEAAARLWSRVAVHEDCHTWRRVLIYLTAGENPGAASQLLLEHPLAREALRG